MRRLMMAGMLVGALGVFVSPAGADLTLKVFDSYGTSGGGEFLAQPVSGWTFSPVSLGEVTGRFQTFCLETHESLGFNTKYYAVLNAGAVFGNGGGTGTFDPLNPMTAYLYDGFIERQLTGYQYEPTVDANHNGTPDRIESANALQKVIWYVEGEEGAGHTPGQWLGTGTLARTFYDDAANAVGSGSWTGLNGVQVLNLYGNPEHTSLKQDVLVKVPAPGAVLLGWLGLALVGWFRRRFA